MANQYGTEESFLVYRIVGAGSVGAFETYYGLIQVKSFNSYEEAEIWIKDEGDRHINYTILPNFRNK